MSSIPNLFTPFKTKRAFEEIADQIKELIYSGVFKPGDKLPSERELANQFKSGRMVVREALRTLEHSGLVFIKQGSSGGAFIKNIDTTPIIRSISDMIKTGNVTLQNLTEVRLGIEMLILQSAFEKMTDDDLILLTKNIEESEEKVLKGVRILQENMEFHILLAKATKNPLYESIIRSIMEVTRSFMVSVDPGMEYVNQVVRYHKEIHDSIMEKNFQRAKEKMKEHLLDINKKVLELAGNGS
jgi:DNA-binding FadR family transcriptional regulator